VVLVLQTGRPIRGIVVKAVAVFVALSIGCWHVVAILIDQKRTDLLRHQMMVFAVAMDRFACMEQRYPGPTLTDSIRAVRQHPDLRADYGGPRDIELSGTDTWGRPMIFEWHDANSFRIRSCGPNRRDDGGSGDDIEISRQLNKEDYRLRKIKAQGANGRDGNMFRDLQPIRETQPAERRGPDSPSRSGNSAAR